MTKRKPLEWVGDGTYGYLPDCSKCVDYMSRPHLVGAAASVGIERGMSTGEVLRSVTDRFHAHNHQR